MTDYGDPGRQKFRRYGHKQIPQTRWTLFNTVTNLKEIVVQNVRGMINGSQATYPMETRR